MNLTDEQIEQNAAAYIAAKKGKRWEILLSSGVWKEGTNALQRIEYWLAREHLCRPAPEPAPPQPWDCPDDVPPVCWIKARASGWPCLVCEVDDEFIRVGSAPALRILWENIDGYLHSTDRKTWKPCTK